MATMHGPSHTTCAAPGAVLSSNSRPTEAPLRMFMNYLDPEVADRLKDPDGARQDRPPARLGEAYDAIVATLETPEDDETLLVQLGKPVGVFRTNVWAPRVFLAHSNFAGD